MRISSRASAASIIALSLAFGCVKKNDSAAKTIKNTDTGEELVEDVATLPVEGDANGTVSTDPQELNNAALRSIAYCYSSNDASGSPVSVTSRYVRAADVWNIVRSSAPSAEEASRYVERGVAAAGAAVIGGTAAGTAANAALSLEDISRPRMNSKTLDTLLNKIVRFNQRIVPNKETGTFFIYARSSEPGFFVRYEFNRRGKSVGSQAIPESAPEIMAVFKGQSTVQFRDGKNVFKVTRISPPGTPLNEVKYSVVESNALPGMQRTYGRPMEMSLDDVKTLAAKSGDKGGKKLKGIQAAFEPWTTKLNKNQANSVKNSVNEALNNVNVPAAVREEGISGLAHCTKGGNTLVRVGCIGAAVTAMAGTAIVTNSFLNAKTPEEQELALSEHMDELEAVAQGQSDVPGAPSFDTSSLAAPDVKLDGATFELIKGKIVAASAASDLPECVLTEGVAGNDGNAAPAQ